MKYKKILKSFFISADYYDPSLYYYVSIDVKLNMLPVAYT